VISEPNWLPKLLLLSESGGDWNKYCANVYDAFLSDFVASQPTFRGKWIRFRKDPICQNKEAGFWHCISEGRDEQNRTPDIARCERIKWVRAVIENASDPRVEVWERRDGSECRIHFWFDERYLVVLGERGRIYQLITAFCTDRNHTIRNKQRERDRCKRLTPPF
jgi:hypothetical protein